MARGWESKSVEAQQEERLRQEEPAETLSAEARAVLARRRVLELSLKRARADLRASGQPAHRLMLEQAVKALEDQLAAL
jgi:hypothetical protein